MRRLLLLLLTSCLAASAPSGLRYRMRLWTRGAEEPLEASFLLRATPAIRSANRVQKPRFGGWELVPVDGEGAARTLLLARARHLLFLAGPVPQAKRLALRLSFQGRPLQAWSLAVPPGAEASATLVELQPGLLALCDLSARPSGSDDARVELHLEALGPLGAGAPPENGTALLGTLAQWARTPAQTDGVVVLK